MPITLSDHHLIISPANDDETSGSNWSQQFIPKVISLILDHRPAYIVAAPYADDFDYDGYETAVEWREKMTSEGTYVVGGPHVWTDRDIRNAALEERFELAELWFYIPTSTDAEAEIDPQVLFRNFFRPLTVEENVTEAAECIGRVADGKWLIWNGTSEERRATLQTELTDLATKYDLTL